MSTTSRQDNSNPPPRQFTEPEVRHKFLIHLRNIVESWADETGKTDRDKCEGVAFSILSAIDGCSIAIPAFMLIPNPHPDDKNFARKQGENWYPEWSRAEACDIAGGLHEEIGQLYAKEGAA